MKVLKLLILKDKLCSWISAFGKKVVCLVKKVFNGPAKFLKDGRPGSLILCGLLESFLIYEYEKLSFGYQLLFLFVSALCVFLINEVLVFIFKIFFKSKNRSFIYFINAFLILLFALSNFINDSIAFAIYSAITIFLLALDLFGRSLWSILIKKNFKKVFGYVCLIICGSINGFIGYLIFSDNFGKSIIPVYAEVYNSKEALSENEKSDFENYFSEGKYTVKNIEYGISEKENIIKTNIVDLSDFANWDEKIKFYQKKFFDFELDRAPVTGKIWYPEEASKCPVLFIVHGNHNYRTPSHLGYEYLGNYLASNGYVVVSIDETFLNNCCNENDARAIMILENIKSILEKSEEKNYCLYKKIDKNNIAIAGHSRGGESVATAYLFNSLSHYPDNGTKKFNYNFKIKSIIAIAPTVDQYMPAGHAVEIKNVNYLLLHGSDDSDVNTVMGKKQYENVIYNDSTEKYFKSRVFIMGANHGQFNSLWGQYDYPGFIKNILSTNQLITQEEQQQIAKVYIKAFLDATLLNKESYVDIFYDSQKYFSVLPQTVYETVYESSDFIELLGFDEDTDIYHGRNNDIRVYTRDFKVWKEKREYWSEGDKENFLLYLEWDEKNTNPSVDFIFPSQDFTNKKLSLKIADARENVYTSDGLEKFRYAITLRDERGKVISLKNIPAVLPSIGVQLYKIDVFQKKYYYINEMQTLLLSPSDFMQNEDFDFTKVQSISLVFTGKKTGSVYIDGIGLEPL